MLHFSQIFIIARSYVEPISVTSVIARDTRLFIISHGDVAVIIIFNSRRRVLYLRRNFSRVTLVKSYRIKSGRENRIFPCCSRGFNSFSIEMHLRSRVHPDGADAPRLQDLLLSLVLSLMPYRVLFNMVSFIIALLYRQPGEPMKSTRVVSPLLF